jgi:hypothetical protein
MFFEWRKHMKNLLNSMLVVTMLVSPFMVKADDVTDATIAQIAAEASMDQATINNATEYAGNKYSVNADQSILGHVYATERNPVSKAVRRAGRRVARAFSSEKTRLNNERNYDIAIGGYKPLIESGEISSAEVPTQFRQVLSDEVFGKQPSMFTRGMNSVKSAGSYVVGAFKGAGSSVMNKATLAKNYVTAEWSKAQGAKGVALFAGKALAATSLTALAVYGTYYLYKKVTAKLASKKAQQAQPRRAMQFKKRKQLAASRLTLNARRSA